MSKDTSSSYVDLSLTDKGFLATFDDGTQQAMNSDRSFNQFLADNADLTFLFHSSLDTLRHSKLWVQLWLGKLNILHGLNWNP